MWPDWKAIQVDVFSCLFYCLFFNSSPLTNNLQSGDPVFPGGEQKILVVRRSMKTARIHEEQQLLEWSRIAIGDLVFCQFLIRIEHSGKVRTPSCDDGPVSVKRSAADHELDVGELAVGCSTPQLLAVQPIDEAERIFVVQFLQHYFEVKSTIFREIATRIEKRESRWSVFERHTPRKLVCRVLDINNFQTASARIPGKQLWSTRVSCFTGGRDDYGRVINGINRRTIIIKNCQDAG